jgi:hypothetical protein
MNKSLTILFLLITNMAVAQDQGFEIAERPSDKQVDIMYNGKL